MYFTTGGPAQYHDRSMDGWSVLAQILIVLAAATVFGLAAQRVGQNAITGYLLAGVVLAPFFLRAAGRDVIRLLAEIGVAMLLFTIGLEFSMTRLRALGPRVAWLGLAQILGTTAVVAAVARLAGMPVSAAVILGAAAAMSSTTVVMRLISERSELDSAHGRAAMGVALIQDLAVVPAMLLIPIFAGAQEGAQGLRILAAALAKAAAMLAGLYALMRWVAPRMLMRAARAQNRDLPVLLAAVACLGSSWVSHALGLSAVLGAFAAGIILSECMLAEQVRADVIPLRAAFLPLFFTSAGMLAGVADWASAGRMAAFVAGLIVVKTAVVLLAGVALRMPAPEALRAGLSLAQVGEFSFVLLEFARSAGLLEDRLVRLLLAVSVTSLLLSPPLAAAAPRVSRWLASRRGGPPPPGELPLKSPSEHVVVIGFGPAGRQVVETLRERGQSVVIVDLNPKTAAGSSPDLPIEYGDATQEEILRRAGVPRARAVVVTVPDPLTARNVVAQARRLAGAAPIIARARYHIHRDALTEAGSDGVVSEEVVVGRELARETLTALGVL